MDCSLPGSSVRGIFQAIVLEWIAISFFRGSSQPRARTRVSRIVDRRFTVWATREVRQHIKKQRHCFVNKGPSSQGYGFSSGHVWMWKLDCEESWVLKNWCFWTWRRLLRVPWTARRSNQSILKEIGPGCSLEGLMMKLKLQYFGHLMWRVDSLEKTLMLGGIEKETTENKMAGWHHRLDGREFEWTLGVVDG